MRYITFFTAILFSIAMQSQSPIGFSLTGGMNSTSLKSDDLLAESGVGYKAGLIFNCGYHETYNYQIEVMYNKNSLNLLTVDNDFMQQGNSKYQSTSIDFGLFLNYYVLVPDEDKFYIGPQAGVNFSFGNDFTPSGGRDTSGEYYLPYLLEENDFIYQDKINYSLGLGLTGGYNNFRFDLRYSLGMNNVLANVQTHDYDENNIYRGPSLEGKFNTISFTISYRIWRLVGLE